MAGVLFGSKGSLKSTASCAKILALIVVTLGCCVAAPSNSNHPRQKTNSKRALDNLWSYPCAGQDKSTSDKFRHARSTTVADSELKFFIVHLKDKHIKDMKKLYSSSPRISMNRIKGRCPRYNSLVQPISKSTTEAQAYKQFHLSMYKLAVFMGDLQDIDIETNSQVNLEQRRRIYDKTRKLLKLSICEFQHTLKKEFNETFSPKPPKVKRKCLPKGSVSLGQVQMLDMQFLKTLKKVIRNGRKILAQKKSIARSQRRTKSF